MSDTKANIPLDLPPHLFWDTSFEDIDQQAHARFIIERVVTRGDYASWKKIRAHFGDELIKGEVIHMKGLDPKTLHFLAHFYEIDLDKFRCYTEKPSVKKHWIY